MRIMLDTNVLISAIVFRSPTMQRLIDALAEEHTLVLSSYILEEIHLVFEKKFPDKTMQLEQFLIELPFENEYTPKILPNHNWFRIRDANDEKILYSAITADVDILITGDKDFEDIDIQKPSILTPSAFLKSLE